MPIPARRQLILVQVDHDATLRSNEEIHLPCLDLKGLIFLAETVCWDCCRPGLARSIKDTTFPGLQKLERGRPISSARGGSVEPSARFSLAVAVTFVSFKHDDCGGPQSIHRDCLSAYPTLNIIDPVMATRMH